MEGITEIKKRIAGLARKQGFKKTTIRYTRYLKGGTVRRNGTMTIDL